MRIFNEAAIDHCILFICLDTLALWLRILKKGNRMRLLLCIALLGCVAPMHAKRSIQASKANSREINVYKGMLDLFCKCLDLKITEAAFYECLQEIEVSLLQIDEKMTEKRQLQQRVAFLIGLLEQRANQQDVHLIDYFRALQKEIDNS